jgi:hypothetical protein
VRFGVVGTARRALLSVGSVRGVRACQGRQDRYRHHHLRHRRHRHHRRRHHRYRHHRLRHHRHCHRHHRHRHHRHHAADGLYVYYIIPYPYCSKKKNALGVHPGSLPEQGGPWNSMHLKYAPPLGLTLLGPVACVRHL